MWLARRARRRRWRGLRIGFGAAFGRGVLASARRIVGGAFDVGVRTTSAAALARLRRLVVLVLVGLFLGAHQRFAVGDGDLVVVGVDFAEGEEAVAIAAIFDEGRLQGRLYARDLGEVDVAAQLAAALAIQSRILRACYRW